MCSTDGDEVSQTVSVFNRDIPLLEQSDRNNVVYVQLLPKLFFMFLVTDSTDSALFVVPPQGLATPTIPNSSI